MNGIVKRIFSLLVAVVLAMGAGVPAVRAEEVGEERNIFYGNIMVQAVGASSAKTYRAARDENDVVYIHAEDYAEIAGGSVSKGATRQSYRYRIGNWVFEVDCENQEADLFYNPFETALGYPLYGTFEMGECLYNESEECWYIPFAELMYLSHMEWMCQDQIVFAMRPETLVDIVSEYEALTAGNPGYTDIMGEDEWEQLGNSFKYGFQAAIDELNMTFIMDSILTSFSVKDSLSYEDDVLNAALLMLRTDTPGEDAYSTTDAGFDGTADFVSGVSTALELGSKDITSDISLTLLSDMLGISMSAKQLSAIANHADVGSNVINYAIGVGQALWTRDYMPESFGQRLNVISDFCDGDSEDEFIRRLDKAATEAYDLYYGDVKNAYTNGVTIDSVFGLVDGVAGLGGVDLGKNDIAITPLRWAKLTVTVIDTGVEVMKEMVPSIKEALEEAEDVHLSLDLVNISTVMNSAYEDAVEVLRDHYRSLTQGDLHTIRVTAQIAQCAAMHAHTTLIGIDKMAQCQVLEEQQLLQRLAQSAKYDRLLVLDTTFSDLYVEEPGCVRMEIPPEYVFGLPVIRFEYKSGITNVEATPEAEGAQVPEGQKIYITTDTDDWDIMRKITLRHETYGEYTYESQLYSWRGVLMGVDMGDGQYTYVLSVYASGTIGGCEVVFLRPVDGKLTAVKIFDTRQRSDDIYVEGKFQDSATLTGVIYPTGTTFEGQVSYADAARAGTEIWENGTGVATYELNEEGCYDLLFYTYQRNLMNMDVIGGSSTRYVLKDGELVMAEQWFEFA